MAIMRGRRYFEITKRNRTTSVTSRTFDLLIWIVHGFVRSLSLASASADGRNRYSLTIESARQNSLEVVVGKGAEQNAPHC